MVYSRGRVDTRVRAARSVVCFSSRNCSNCTCTCLLCDGQKFIERNVDRALLDGLCLPLIRLRDRSSRTDT